MTDMKKSRSRAHVETQLISDPELGKVLTLSTPSEVDDASSPESREEASLEHTGHATTQLSTDEIGALARAMQPRHTAQLGADEISAMLAHADLHSGETLSLHRVPSSSSEQDTVKWKHRELAGMLEEAASAAPPASHRTEQISDLELGAIMQHAKVKPSSTVSDGTEGETVRWKTGALAAIVSDVEAAALMEISSARDNDHALLDEEDRYPTQTVKQEELDALMALATAQRPRHGTSSQELTSQKSESPRSPVVAAPRVALLEERMPVVNRSPHGEYRSGGMMEEASRTHTQTLLVVLIALMVLLLIGNVLYLMWPKGAPPVAPYTPPATTPDSSSKPIH